MFVNFFDIINNKEDTQKPKELVLSDKKIKSLDMLRENFDAEEILKALGNGSLVGFLKSHFYEREADVLSKLSLESKDCLEIICGTLGIRYQKKADELTESELKKMKFLKNYPLDSDVFKNLDSIALNQEELAILLKKGKKLIYLCNGVFSIPLSKSGIKYIGIENPKIESPFTKELYTKAGILVESIDLPANVSKKMEEYALKIAKKNGYDGYSENHSALASHFHNVLKGEKIFSYISLPYNLQADSKLFSSKYTANQELRNFLRKPYDVACSYVDTSSSRCLARKASDGYAKFIQDLFDPIMTNLKTLFSQKGKSDLYGTLVSLVNDSQNALLKTFNEEICGNREYYNMYDFDYFVDRVTLEEHDYSTTEGVFKVIESIFSETKEYTYDGFRESIMEMEKDINHRAASFFKVADREYLSYVREIEKIIESLGNDFPPINENESISDYLAKVCAKIVLS